MPLNLLQQTHLNLRILLLNLIKQLIYLLVLLAYILLYLRLQRLERHLRELRLLLKILIDRFLCHLEVLLVFLKVLGRLAWPIGCQDTVVTYVILLFEVVILVWEDALSNAQGLMVTVVFRFDVEDAVF